MLWFAEILEQRLYRQLGYGSIHQYAGEALGFSKGKTSQFIRLSESLRSLPKLKQAVATGDISWTKAREVAAEAQPGACPLAAPVTVQLRFPAEQLAQSAAGTRASSRFTIWCRSSSGAATTCRT